MQDIIKTYSNYTEILISFLNDTLKPKKKIVSVDIKKTQKNNILKINTQGLM